MIQRHVQQSFEISHVFEASHPFSKHSLTFVLTQFSSVFWCGWQSCDTTICIHFSFNAILILDDLDDSYTKCLEVIKVNILIDFHSEWMENVTYRVFLWPKMRVIRKDLRNHQVEHSDQVLWCLDGRCGL